MQANTGPRSLLGAKSGQTAPAVEKDCHTDFLPTATSGHTCTVRNVARGGGRGLAHPPTTTDCHQPPSKAVDCHQAPPAASNCIQLLPTSTDRHQLVPISTNYHRLSPQTA
eukprot:gene12360-biopygen16935